MGQMLGPVTYTPSPYRPNQKQGLWGQVHPSLQRQPAANPAPNPCHPSCPQGLFSSSPQENGSKEFHSSPQTSAARATESRKDRELGLSMLQPLQPGLETIEKPSAASQPGSRSCHIGLLRGAAKHSTRPSEPPLGALPLHILTSSGSQQIPMSASHIEGESWAPAPCPEVVTQPPGPGQGKVHTGTASAWPGVMTQLELIAPAWQPPVVPEGWLTLCSTPGPALLTLPPPHSLPGLLLPPASNAPPPCLVLDKLSPIHLLPRRPGRLQRRWH